jgi:hypothetical protein
MTKHIVPTAVNHLDLYNRISNIPFLDLGPIPNFEAMKREALAVAQSSELQVLHSRNPVDYTYLNLVVDGIFDYEGKANIANHCNTCLNEQMDKEDKEAIDFKEGTRTLPTEFSKKTPALTSYISDILEHPGRARFSVLGAGKDVGWHSHYYPNSTEMILHICLSSNEKTLAQVGRFDVVDNVTPFERWFDVPENVHSQHFNEGHLWLLNSRHYHRFTNPSDQDRVHVWICTFLQDSDNILVNSKLHDMISKAADNYTGVLLDKETGI